MYNIGEVLTTRKDQGLLPNHVKMKKRVLKEKNKKKILKNCNMQKAFRVFARPCRSPSLIRMIFIHPHRSFSSLGRLGAHDVGGNRSALEMSMPMTDADAPMLEWSCLLAILLVSIVRRMYYCMMYVHTEAW